MRKGNERHLCFEACINGRMILVTFTNIDGIHLTKIVSTKIMKILKRSNQEETSQSRNIFILILYTINKICQ